MKMAIVVEAFADRNYNSDYSLVSRNKVDALISDPELLWQHLYRMIVDRQLRCIDGSLLTMEAATFCFHGDHPKAAKMLNYVSSKLASHHLKLAKKN